MKNKNTGNIRQLKIHITDPIKMEMDIEMNKLSVFVGANGTGKTFILINTFAISSIAQAIVLHKFPPSTLSLVAQYIYDNCFTDQNINGTISAEFENGPAISIEFDKGKVKNLTYDAFDDVEQPIRVVFMSSQFRTFNAISGYLQMRKMIYRGDQEQYMKEALDMYKLYDVMVIEGLIAKMPLMLDKTMLDLFKSYDITEEITGVSVDLDKCDFYTVGPKGNKYMCTYGSGHQSVFNMFLTQLP